MFGSYAHPEEDDSISASGSFSLASLAGSKNYKRRLGSRTGGGGSLPVRISQGGSVKKTIPTPVRRTHESGGHSVSDFSSKLKAIEEDDNQEKKTEAHNVSLSDLLGSKCVLNTPNLGPKVQERTEVKTLLQGEKISPDSGSFTMSNTKTRTFALESTKERDAGAMDFTDSLKKHQSSNVSINSSINKPVRVPPQKTGLGMRSESSQGPVRIGTKQIGDLKTLTGPVGKENIPLSSHQEDNAEKTSITSRLQMLSGHHDLVTPVKKEPVPVVDLVTPAKNDPPPCPVTVHPKPQMPAPAPAAEKYHHLPTPVKSVSLMDNKPPGSVASSHFVTPVPVRSVSATAMPPPKSTSKETFLHVRGKRYKVMKLLGKGGSSRVYEAFDEDRNTVVAIKRVDLSDADESQREGFINEINMLYKLQGQDRIIKLFDYENVENDMDELLYVVMEKGDTDLASLLKKYATNKELTPAMIKHYWAEMLHAVQCIHNSGIIHKDLKPANFMLVAGRLKLIDFGIATSIQSDKTSITIDNQMGTFNYMSPESIQDQSGPQVDKQGNRKPCIKISYKTDVWSLGCILYQLTYGKLPFADIKYPLMKLQAITNVDHTIEFPQLPNIDTRLVDVLRSCLERDIRKRANIDELLGHSYLSGELAPAPVVAPAINARMLSELEGILSPNTFKKTKKILQNH